MSQKLSTYRKIAGMLIERWKPMLRGLRGEERIMNTAILLENTWRYGAMYLNEGMISEFTGSTLAGPSGQVPQIAVFRHYLMPLIRRMYPNLITNSLVGVQPMTGPTSQIFYLKYFYSGMVDQQNPWGTAATAKGATAPGTEYANFVGNTWFVDPYYSLQTVRREPLSIGGGTIGAGMAAFPSTGTHAAVQANAPIFNNSAKLYVLMGTAATYAGCMAAGQTLHLVELTGWVNAAAPAALTATVLATLNGAAVITNLFTGFINAATNTFSLTVAAGSMTNLLSNAEVALAVAAGQPFLGMNTFTYDINMENRPELPELSLEIDSHLVEVQTRKLRTVWSIEAAQDMRAMHQIDAEKELVSLLSSEIAAEIDRETLNNLIINAGHRRNYDYSNPFIVGGFAVGGGTGMLSYNQAAALPGIGGAPWYTVPGSGNFNDRNRALLYQFLELGNDIYRQTLRGQANWVVTSPAIAAKLESLSEYEAVKGADNMYSVGIKETGMLQSKFRVVVDPLFPEDLVLMGYKGPTNMDAGYFYCPYIPLQLTPTIMDPRTYNPSKGILTRYGKLIVENGERFYGIIKVSNLGAMGTTIPAGYPIQTSTSISGSNLISGNTDLV